MWKRLMVAAMGAGAVGGLFGCSVDPKPAFRDVDATVAARIGQHVRWNTGSAEDAEAGRAVTGLLATELTADSAVAVALLNNRELQATFEEIGIAQADLVQAGMLRNPEFAASWRLPDRAPRQTDAEYAVSEDFLELLVLPLRKKVAAAELERTKARVADAVLKLAAEVKTSVYELQAQEELVARLREVDAANQAAAELSRRQHAAGTINDLDLTNQEAVASQSGLEVMQAELDRTIAREKVNRLMGLGGGEMWTVAGALPELPAREMAVEGLEERAVRERLDLAASRMEVAGLEKSVGITRDFRYFSAVKVGVDTEHMGGEPRVTGPTLDLEIPLFDQGQARVATAVGAARAARDRLMQEEVEVRAEVREAAARVAAERKIAGAFAVVLQQRRDVLHQTMLHYNAMLKGTYDLLSARQNEVAAERGEVGALRDYWMARAALERAVGGRLDR